MAATNLTLLTQEYWEKEWLNLKENDFLTPLANSDWGIKATIPKQQAGLSAEFSFFNTLNVEATSATDDSPKMYAETAEPSSDTLTRTTYHVPLMEIARVISLGHLFVASDPANVIEESFRKFKNILKCHVHRVINDAFVTQIADTNSFNPSGATLPPAFKTLYSGFGPDGVFSDLTGDSLVTMNDFIFARSLLENDSIDPFDNGNYKAVISPAVKNQLLRDPEFNDVAKRHAALATKAFGRAMIPDYQGFDWVIQSTRESYRCKLPEASGALATRQNSGAVHVSHVFGADSYGYVDLGKDKNVLVPEFKTQDITITGIELTIGFRVPYRAAVLRQDRGYNIAGTSQFNYAGSDIG